MLRINKKILNFNDMRSQIYNTTSLTLSLFCVLGLLFVLVFGTNLAGNNYGIINTVWADEINGTENADSITGTVNQDTIKGFQGNDTIGGREAGDDISGGDGDDAIYGNEGRDWLRGGSENDHIQGGEGNDMLFGDRGNDTLNGGPGNDTLTGGPDKDIFNCGTGPDTVTDFNVTQQDSAPENDCENIKDNNTNVNGTSFSQQKLSGNAENIKTNETVDDITNITIDKNNNDPLQRLFFGLINNRLF
jgi:Ca2+-binding RTX toxin-like protein